MIVEHVFTCSKIAMCHEMRMAAVPYIFGVWNPVIKNMRKNGKSINSKSLEHAQFI